MGNPYAFGHKSIETYRLQVALVERQFLPEIDPATGKKNADYIYGTNTRNAVTTIQHMLGIVATGQPDKAVLVYLGLAPASSPSIFDQIGTVLSIINLLKGKTMTQDQINGVIRAVLTAAGGFLIGRGLITAEMWTWLSAGVLTIGPMVWSWISNRPKTIVPIASK